MIVFVGYNEPKQSNISVNTVNINQSSQPSIDNVVATTIASSVAQSSNLPIANNIANMSVSAKIDRELAQLNNINTVKPQIIGSSTNNRLVTTYTVVNGDTVDSLAIKFGISKDTIKNANNLIGDVLSVGTSLQILPVDGVIYTVKTGDTIDSLAKKYSVDKTRLVLYNDLDISGLTPDTKIILPNATLPADEKPGYIAPVTYVIAYGYSGGNVQYLNSSPNMSEAVRNYIPHIGSLFESSGGNRMTLGNCTWWAWERRKALGRPLPNGFLGNAGSWGYNLQNNYSYLVDSNPEVGAIFEDYGHVGIVERINRDASGNIVSFLTSEMNYNWTLYGVVERTIPASNIGNFNYIH